MTETPKEETRAKIEKPKEDTVALSYVPEMPKQEIRESPKSQAKVIPKT